MLYVVKLGVYHRVYKKVTRDRQTYVHSADSQYWSIYIELIVIDSKMNTEIRTEKL